MIPPWLFGRLQIVALAALGYVAFRRGILLRRQGIALVPSPRDRPWVGRLRGAALGLDIGLWAYEIVACAWPLPVHVAPGAWVAPVLPWSSTRLAGVGLLAAGLVVYAAALRDLGASWRLGIDRGSVGPLVTSGVYAWSRNPIYVGLLLFSYGTALVLGNWLFLAIAPVTTICIHLVVRAEERFLAQAFGEAYRGYASRVGRYVTWPAGGRGPHGAAGRPEQGP